MSNQRILDDLHKISNPARFFDPAIKSVYVKTLSELIRTTNIKTRTTNDNWMKSSSKVADSVYEIVNNVKTTDNKKNIVDILNDGRGKIYAPEGKKLYIPLTNRASAKKTGDKIPKHFKYGVDYVLKKEVAAYKGTQFIDKIGSVLPTELENELARKMSEIL